MVSDKKIDLVIESTILNQLKHENIIKAIDFYQIESLHPLQALVLEYSQRGDLLDYINKQRGLSELKCKNIFKQLVDAMAYIHSNHYVHLDIKPDNILLFDNDVIKLADFGFAEKYDPNQSCIRARGSGIYAAPELFKKIPTIGPELDIWSAGITLYCIFYFHMPIINSNSKNAMEALDQLEQQGLQFNSSKTVSIDFINLVKSMLNFNSTNRITIKQIQQSVWLNNDNLKLDLTKLNVGDDSPVQISLCSPNLESINIQSP